MSQVPRHIQSQPEQPWRCETLPTEREPSVAARTEGSKPQQLRASAGSMPRLHVPQ